ncbi:hypothetical protein BGAL_0561g00030 [Botrytis galanthina]|uniref:Uncharacterized protein n=1 Tax=Botrytis galanthina TaxID=278940 RepID=A0A4S8QIZ3_9HELO|nr:hypothetical protein BGAL_0561g00030 [Botrytis galanthina]
MNPSRGGDKNYAMRMPSNATWSKLDMEKHATDICKIPLHEAGFLLDSNQGSEQEFHDKMLKYRVGPNVESLQTVKQSKIEDPKEIADMRDLYIENTRKYADSLINKFLTFFRVMNDGSHFMMFVRGFRLFALVGYIQFCFVLELVANVVNVVNV